MKNKEILNNFPETLTKEVIVDNGFLSSNFKKEDRTYDRVLEITNDGYSLYYKDVFGNKVFESIVDKTIDGLIEKYNESIKDIEWKISDKKWKEYMDYQKSDIYF